MNKQKLLIIDPDTSLTQTLHAAFTQEGYEVLVAHTGQQGLELARTNSLNVLLLDMHLPDMTSEDFLDNLYPTFWELYSRAIIFLGQANDLQRWYVSVEAMDLIAKPFDFEELTLRIKNLASAVKFIRYVDPITKPWLGRTLEARYQDVVKNRQAWTYFDLRINHIKDFYAVYPSSNSGKVRNFIARLIGKAIDLLGTSEDFAGHRPQRDSLTLISYSTHAAQLANYLINQFNAEVKQYYSSVDRERGYMVVDANDEAREIPLMTLDIGWVSWTSELKVDDLGEIEALAIEDRGRRSGLSEIDPQ